MKPIDRFACTLTVAAIAILAAGQDAASQELSAVSVAAGHNTGVEALRRWDEVVYQLTGAGNLAVTSRLNDRTVPGRAHEYLAQTVDGIPVLGGGISRQIDAAGVTVSLLGTLHQDVDVDATPTLTTTEAVFLLERAQGGRTVADPRPALVVLPLPDGTYALSYRIAMSDGRYYFVDADDGRIIRAVDALRTQSAVGAGSGFRGQRMKLSTTHAGTRFQASDRLRPAEIVTIDLRFNVHRYVRLLFSHFEDGLVPGVRVWNSDDVASDADNDWDDAAVVEAHAHTGWTYDYLYSRHGWQGLDGANGRILSIVNVDFGGPNAVAVSPPFGPEGTGVYVYGQAADATGEEPLTSLDVIAHELMHGVTHFSVSRRTGDPLGLGTALPSSTRLGPTSVTTDDGETFPCDPDLLWCVDGRFVLSSAQGGAVNETYSDIVGESVGFFHEDAGATADYLQGGDQSFGPIRSLADPGSLSIVDGFPYPDAYQNRYEFAIFRNTLISTRNPSYAGLDLGGEPDYWEYAGLVFVNGQFAFFSPGGSGYGGEHWNSTILSHAFYLAIEGGTNRTTGLRVDGVGDAGRGEVERIFFRALTDLMPAATSLPLAANAIRQAAADLAPGSEAQRAVTQALVAVGLPPA
ncbi:MAG: M4 family metallopeptidase [Acidobacteria bacterium]|nr:M4 family metallopeptidase [Acidobacteriota bacterium]